MPTGWAAPALVPGAMAATGQPTRMNVPADAARAPDGPTQQTTGTGDRRTALVIARIEESSPPGVSRRTRTAATTGRSVGATPDAASALHRAASTAIPIIAPTTRRIRIRSVRAGERLTL